MNVFKLQTSRHLFLVTMAVAALVTTAQSQEVDTSDWDCEFCPFESGYRADYQLGVTNVSDDAAYLGDANGYSEEGNYANVDGAGSYSSDGHQLRWLVKDLGLDSRYAELAGNRQGKLDYSVSYREIPRTQFFGSETIFQQSTSDTLSLPANWVRAANTAGMSELNTGLAVRDIDSDRSILQIGGRYKLTNRISFSADYRRQEQQGVDIAGGSYFFQASQLAKPIDYVTDSADFDIRYTTDNGFLSVAWYFSDFESDTAGTNWENPFTSAPGSEFATLAQAPGNNFNQVSLLGGYNFSSTRTSVAFSVTAGRMTQNRAFLPYTSNANVVVSPLPRLSLDGEVDTSNLAFSITTRAIKKARIKLEYRYDERDNGTLQDVWSGVIAEAFVTAATTNIPYSFERSRLGLSADYDLFDTVRVSGGYERKQIDRDFQEVAEQTEDNGWGRVRWSPNGAVQIDIKGGASRRDIDSYNEVFAATLGQNPLLRKYNLAFRYRTFGELTFVAAFPESPVTFTLNGLFADDSYTRSIMGLTSGEELGFTGDLSWALGGKSSLYLTGGFENIDSEQFGSELFAREDWRASNNDEFITVGGGVRIREIGGKFDFQLDYTHSEGTSEIDLVSNVSGQSQFPDLESTLEYLRAQISYRHSDRLELVANLRYQSFLAKNWALEGVGPDTILSVLSLGAQPYDEDTLIFGLGFKYSIGGQQ